MTLKVPKLKTVYDGVKLHASEQSLLLSPAYRRTVLELPEDWSEKRYTVQTLPDHPFVSVDQCVALCEIVDRAERQLLPRMGFHLGMDLFFTEPGDLSSDTTNSLVMGTYERGTSAKPLIEIDIYLLATQADARGNNVFNEFKTTLAHELAHAWQDRHGLLDFPDTEDNAEAFGRRWCYTAEADLFVLRKGTKP